jgi:hypothetical protein
MRDEARKFVLQWSVLHGRPSRRVESQKRWEPRTPRSMMTFTRLTLPRARVRRQPLLLLCTNRFHIISGHLRDVES